MKPEIYHEYFAGFSQLSDLAPEIAHGISELSADTDASHCAEVVTVLREYFIKMTTRDVVEAVTRKNLRNSALGPDELHKRLCKAFDNGELPNFAVPVIWLKANEECELLILNVTNRVHRISVGEFLSGPSESFRLIVQCKDAKINLCFQQYRLEIVGPARQIPPREIACVPLDLDCVSENDLRTGLVEILLEMTLDGEVYTVPASFLFQSKEN